jgi:ATP-dependent RNA helicase RhlE
MPTDIAKLAAEILRDPVRIDVSPKEITVDRIDQRVYFVPAQGKRNLLTELLADPAMDRVLVFTRTKRNADRVCKFLRQDGLAVEALHGNKAQNARIRALESFRSGKVRILVATDIAARGIDVPAISHVINYELPNEPESYVHRIGRTARAGNGGAAIAFCDASERSYLKAIEGLMRKSVPVAGHRQGAAEPRSAETKPHGRRPEPRSAGIKSHGWRPEPKSAGTKSQGRRPEPARAESKAKGRHPEQTAKAPAPKPSWRSGGRRGGALPSARGGLTRPRAARVSLSGEAR